MFLFENTAYVLFYDEKKEKTFPTGHTFKKKKRQKNHRVDSPVSTWLAPAFMGVAVWESDARTAGPALAGNHPCGAKPANHVDSSRASPAGTRSELRLPSPRRSPSEESWSGTSRHLPEGDKGWPMAGPDIRFLMPFFFGGVKRVIPGDTGRSGAHPDSS